jgi:hypothetical protein
MEWIYFFIYIIGVIFIKHFIPQLFQTKKEKLIKEDIKELRKRIKTEPEKKVELKSQIIELKLGSFGMIIKELFFRFGLIWLSFYIYLKIFTISIWWYILALIILQILFKRLFKWER